MKKKLLITVCVIVGTPFILGGIFWVFVKDAFRFGREVGASFLEYLESL